MVGRVDNTAVVLIFALSFYHPRTKRDWRSFGAFSAFILALFTEMYGFPLTVYLLSGWLASRFPGLDLFAHDSGHLWSTLFGWEGDPHLSAFHLVSGVLIGAGLIIISSAWRVLLHAQRDGYVAQTGPYQFLRHPQYMGFILIMIGFLLQWPTLITLLMFPVLVLMYVRLAIREEKEAVEIFGEAYLNYRQKTPGFFPHLSLRNLGQPF
jgi:protein-S-isoprenylcysteine O-methyltransferase Ste14